MVVDPAWHHSVSSFDLVFLATEASKNADMLLSVVHSLQSSSIRIPWVVCEKPLAVSIGQIEKLEKIPDRIKQFILIGMNYRYSRYAEMLRLIQDQNDLGNIVLVHFSSSHGLSFKNCPSNFARKAPLISLPVNLGIHFVDLISSSFPGFNVRQLRLVCSNDNQGCIISWGGSALASVQLTYRSAYLKKLTCWFENGIATTDGNNVVISSPRDTFDSSGRFITPPIGLVQELSRSEDGTPEMLSALRSLVSKAGASSTPAEPPELRGSFSELMAINKQLLEATPID